MADDRHPLALADAELVEPGLQRPAAAGDLAVAHLAQRRRRLVRLVDDADPVAVDEFGPVEEVAGGQRHAHAGSRGLGDVVPAARRGHVTLTARRRRRAAPVSAGASSRGRRADRLADDEVREVVVRRRLGVDDRRPARRAPAAISVSPATGHTCSEVPTARKTSQSAAATAAAASTRSSSSWPKLDRGRLQDAAADQARRIGLARRRPGPARCASSSGRGSPGTRPRARCRGSPGPGPGRTRRPGAARRRSG